MYAYAFVTALLVLPFAQDDRAKPAPTPPTATVGKMAPSFRVNNHLGQVVGIGGKAKQWTVVAFYPKALTGG